MRFHALALAFFVLSAAPAPAGEWISSSSLEGLSAPTAADRQRIAQVVKDGIVAYSFEDAGIEWRIHRGDLTIPGSFDNEHALIVDGSLRIAGSYDDYGAGGGLLIVLGDLEAEHVFSWHALYVKGAVRASGLVYGAYNDYAFEADGGVSARGIVMDDHSSGYEVTRAEFDLDNNGSAGEEAFAKMIRLMVPETIAAPGILELDEYSELTSLWPDYEVTKGLVRSGRPVFRSQEAPPGLVADAKLAVAAGTADSALLALLGRDPLTDRLVAARPGLSPRLIEALLARKDPGIAGWLAGHIGDLDQLGGAKVLTLTTAESLVGNPATSEKTLLEIAASPEPAIRRTLAFRADLPAAVLARLVQDPDAELRASVLSNFDNAERLPPAEKARLAKDPEVGVRAAIAGGVPPYETARALAADPSREVRLALAHALAYSVDDPFPPLAAEQREELAETLLAGAAEDPEIATAIVTALSPARQEALFRQQPKGLDWTAAAAETRSQPLMRALFEREQDLELQGHLAQNLALPLELQLAIVARAAKPAKACAECVLFSSPDDVAAALIENDNVAPQALLAAARLAAERRDAGFVDALTNQKDIPLEGLVLLDQKWAGGEDWSLSVILMHAATRPMLEKALPRWYEDEAVAAAVGQLRGLDDRSWWPALAKSGQRELREAAAANVNTPPDLLLALLEDADEGVAASALWNPALPAAALPVLEKKYSGAAVASPLVPLAELAERSRGAATYDLRNEAREAYVKRKQRAW
jgi:hypothetical protein